MSNMTCKSLIGLFYGSSTGSTARIARQMQGMMLQTMNDPYGMLDMMKHHPGLHQHVDVDIELLDVTEFYLEEMLDFQYLILGIPTWNHGQLQADWEVVFDEFDELDLSGKSVALFGLGDQVGYPDTFGDALFFLADKVRTRGARLVGRWPTQGYTFRRSWAVDGEEFLGLMLDEDNQPELSQSRMEKWLTSVALEFFGR